MGASTPPRVIGRYAVHGKIASGGMASVHFGRLSGAAGFSRTVAIKRLHPHLAEDADFLATMIDEARLAASIHHPNVVPTLDVVASDGELMVVMEYIRGESLARLQRAELSRGGRIPLPVVSAVVVGALRGLHAAHEATGDRGAPLGIVHRDISPENVLVGTDGIARVIDFGVAKAAGRLQTTREGVLKGKMAYMAPEQLQAGESVTRRVDVYAMAVVLWEILAGRRLFAADNDGAAFGLVLAGAKDPPSRYAHGLPADLDAAVMTGLARDPLERFETARDMADRIQRIVQPAFPTEVGAWVESVASEDLARRAAILAEVESGPDGAQRPASSPDHAAQIVLDRLASDRPVEAKADAPTLASQPSSLSVETPRPRTVGGRAVRWGRLAGAAGLVAAVAGAAVLRGALGVGASRADAREAGAAAQPASTPGAAPAVASVLPAEASVPEAAASAPSAAALPAPPPPAPTPRPAARPRPASPKPSAAIRFAQPD